VALRTKDAAPEPQNRATLADSKVAARPILFHRQQRHVSERGNGQTVRRMV